MSVDALDWEFDVTSFSRVRTLLVGQVRDLRRAPRPASRKFTDLKSATTGRAQTTRLPHKNQVASD
jgi:hypothetical protein